MHISMHPLLLSTSHFGQTISFVSLRGLDYLIFRESTPLPRPPILSQTAKFHTPFCGTKHFHKSAFTLNTTFHDLLGAFLPCIVRPLFTAFHLIASSCFSFFASVSVLVVCIVPYYSSLHPRTESLIHPHQTPSTSCSLMSLCTWQGGIFDLRSSLCPLPREERREALLSFSWLRNTSLNVDSCLRRGSRSAWETWIKIKIKHQDQGPRPCTHACFAHKLIWQQIVTSSWSILSKTLRSKHKHKHTKLHLH